ncbi:MAG: carbon starvation protein A, partial [Bacteroidales bacterium]|nr:carbon starvation protein A [Bacteroidales bacterium]
LLMGMAVAIVVAFAIYHPEIPELWSGLQTRHPQANVNPIFPMMFLSIACGAVSGFHATQSTLVARCMTNERQGRHIFYGAMIVEGIVALIWAAAAAYFYNSNPALQAKSGPAMVGHIANTWFPAVIAVITILGVISAAVTSGDTALRSARLIVADFMHLEQKSISKRLWIAIPLFVVTGGLLIFSLASPSGFQVIWQYFSWDKQMLAAFTLWAITVYLRRSHEKPYYWISLIPALFMTMVTVSFMFVSRTFFGAFIPRLAGYILATLITIIAGQIFFRKDRTQK